MTAFAPGSFKGSTFTIAFVGVAVRAVKRVFISLRNRHEVAMLTDLDDRALKDIGLMRTDVQAALAGPLHRDPSSHLVDVAGHKRGRLSPASAPQGASALAGGSLRRTPEAAVKTVGPQIACC